MAEDLRFGPGPASWRGMLPAVLSLLACLLVLAGGGCSGDPGTGPVAVKWDRLACERCRMVLSDPRHAAQVRVAQPGGGSRVYFFDDIGCALVWLEDQAFRDAVGTEIWTTDWRTGTWIDARRAFYLPGQVTPMAYGLGAQADPAPEALSFEQAQQRVLDMERRYNVHGGHRTPAASPGAG